MSAGFRGRNCEVDIDDCSDNKCHNGSKCIDLVNGYRCECPPTYKGSDNNLCDCMHMCILTVIFLVDNPVMSVCLTFVHLLFRCFGCMI